HVDIYVVGANGSGLNPIASSPGRDRSPAWSPDGSRLAFSSDRTGNLEIFVVNLDGSGLRNLSNDAGNDSGPVWSHSGKYVAFVSERAGTKSIFTANADGSGLVRVTTHEGGGDDGPAWRPIYAGGGGCASCRGRRYWRGCSRLLLV